LFSEPRYESRSIKLARREKDKQRKDGARDVRKNEIKKIRKKGKREEKERKEGKITKQ
jgi:hypothetical protein